MAAIRADSSRRTGLGLFLLSAIFLAPAPAVTQPNVIAGADTSGPRAAFERFRALSDARQLDSAEGRALLTGELEQVTGPSVGPLDAPDRVLLIGADRAVARVP